MTFGLITVKQFLPPTAAGVSAFLEVACALEKQPPISWKT